MAHSLLIDSLVFGLDGFFFVISEEAVAEKDKVTKDMNMLRQEKDSLQQSVDAFEVEKTKMQTEKQKVHSWL